MHLGIWPLSELVLSVKLTDLFEPFPTLLIAAKVTKTSAAYKACKNLCVLRKCPLPYRPTLTAASTIDQSSETEHVVGETSNAQHLIASCPSLASFGDPRCVVLTGDADFVIVGVFVAVR